MINGRTFNCCDLHQFYDRYPTDEHVIFKTRRMVEHFLRNIGKQTFKNVLELGIARGGSTIWLNELLNPEKFVAIDITTTPVEDLEQYRLESGRTRQLATYYGVDQKDEQMLRQICDVEFENQSFDLIIDDASHYLPETMASFNLLFPRLSEGGLYVIEDWAWSQCMAALSRDQAPILRQYWDKEPLALLPCYIVLAAGSVKDAKDMIESVYVDSYSTYVRRGSGRPAAGFDITESNRFHNGSCLSLAT
jgi:predicted O-methyltransferase YrrM